uniref:Protein kinase domain-containing protein n=1 Tax=Coccolithus braarudii TaxID=221442 RepID=A0A7S0LPY0_9EUKA
MAPEVALEQPYFTSSEVFSWSIIVWQIVAHELPFDAMGVDEHKEKVAKGGRRPSLSQSKWPEALVTLLGECFEVEASRRPSFEELVPRLQKMHAELDKEAGTQTGESRGGCCSLS